MFIFRLPIFPKKYPDAVAASALGGISAVAVVRLSENSPVYAGETSVAVIIATAAQHTISVSAQLWGFPHHGMSGETLF
jgi:hypothetical protein